MKISEQVAAIRWAFPAGDPRIEMVERIVKQIDAEALRCSNMCRTMSALDDTLLAACKTLPDSRLWPELWWIREQLRAMGGETL